jgi:hypothetical protein
LLPSFSEVTQSSSFAIEDLERLRKQVTKKRFIYNSILLLALAVVVIMYLYASAWIVPGFILFIVIAILHFRNWRKGKALYTASYKSLVVANMMESMLKLCSLPNETKDYEYYCEYSPTNRIDDLWIQKSRLFDIRIDETLGEDLFKGKLGLTDFMFSELRLIQEQHSSDSDGHSTKTKVDMFKGILFIADFHKDFEGITIINSNIGRGVIGRMLGRLSSSSFKPPIKLELESEAFNKVYQVRTTDEIKARYLLSSSMMERLVDFKKRNKMPISISFVDSFMCVSMWSNKNHFEGKVSKPVTGKNLEVVYQDLKFLFGMIEDFDLNTRIWNKE